MEKQERKRSFRTRNREETRARILSAAVDEFSRCGFLGARVENIASSSDVTLRMIYHYFKSKASLYAAVLDHVYSEAAEDERAFDPGSCSADEGMRQLIRFTFDHFAARSELVRLDLTENMLKGDYLRQAGMKPPVDMLLIDRMKEFLKAGQREGAFRNDADPVQLWLMIHSLCLSYLSHQHTLSWKLDADLSDPAFVTEWRSFVENAVLDSLRS